MERTIHNLKEWTDGELKTLQNKINLELDTRFMERRQILRGRALDALLDYRKFCGNEIIPIDDNNTYNGGTDLDEIINYFAPDYE